MKTCGPVLTSDKNNLEAEKNMIEHEDREHDPALRKGGSLIILSLGNL